MVLTAGTIWWINRPVTGEHTVSVDSTGKETETRYSYEYDNAGNRIREKTTTTGTTVVTAISITAGTSWRRKIFYD